MFSGLGTAFGAVVAGARAVDQATGASSAAARVAAATTDAAKRVDASVDGALGYKEKTAAAGASVRAQAARADEKTRLTERMRLGGEKVAAQPAVSKAWGFMAAVSHTVGSAVKATVADVRAETDRNADAFSAKIKERQDHRKEAKAARQTDGDAEVEAVEDEATPEAHPYA